MEKIIASHPVHQTADNPDHGSKIKLLNGHLWIKSDLIDQTIGKEARQVYAVYYPRLQTILIAPLTDATFKAAHEVIMLFVKDKNTLGDKSISIQEFLADHDSINASDRDLEYMSVAGLSIVQIII